MNRTIRELRLTGKTPEETQKYLGDWCTKNQFVIKDWNSDGRPFEMRAEPSLKGALISANSGSIVAVYQTRNRCIVFEMSLRKESKDTILHGEFYAAGQEDWKGKEWDLFPKASLIARNPRRQGYAAMERLMSDLQRFEQSAISSIPSSAEGNYIGESTRPAPPIKEETVLCTKCSAQNPEGARFCSKCGSPLNQTTTTTPTASDVQGSAATKRKSTFEVFWGSATSNAFISLAIGITVLFMLLTVPYSLLGIVLSLLVVGDGVIALRLMKINPKRRIRGVAISGICLGIVEFFFQISMYLYYSLK